MDDITEERKKITLGKVVAIQTILFALAVGYLGSLAVTSSARLETLESAPNELQLLSAHDQQSDFVLTNQPREVASVELTVPEGMTKVTVNVTGSIGVENQREDGFGMLRHYVEVGDRGQIAEFTPIEAQQYQTKIFARSEIFENLEPGQVIVIRAIATFPGSSENATANLTAVAMFLP